MKSGSHLPQVTEQTIRETEGPLCSDTGACVCLHMFVCEGKDATGDSATEDYHHGVHVPSEGILGYTFKIKVNDRSLHL